MSEKQGMPPPYESPKKQQGQAYPPSCPPPQGQTYPPQQQEYPPQQQVYPPQQQSYPPQHFPPQQVPPQPVPVPPPQVIPPQQYAQQQQSTEQNTVVVAQQAQPSVVVAPVFHEVPVPTTCTNCHATVLTSTGYETGTLTWIIAVILCIFMIWPCCLIPFCVEACKDVIHKCPNCQQTLGVYRRV